MEEYNQAFIEVLRYGSNYDMVHPQTLIDYLNERQIFFYPNHQSTIHTGKFKAIFQTYFRAGDGSIPDFNSGNLYMLTPEAMALLLNYDALELARKDSAVSQETAIRAIKYARVSIWVTGVLAIVQIVLSIISLYNR